MWRLVLPGLLLAALAIPADAQGADPFAGIFNDLKARWSAVANAESADACAAGPVPRMSFAPTTVYPDAAAAMADGMPQSTHASPGGMTLRSGDKLLQAQQQDIPFAGKQVAAAWMLTLRDANTGANLAAHTLPGSCAPAAIAAMPEGFLMLSGQIVLLLDDSDLHVRALYRLTTPPEITPTGITLLPDNRLLASTTMSPVLLYNLSAPLPQ
ncbi:MAG TPA: hypothetical protein VHX18_10655 [Rhizomicrobium sp.]|jgi:hypothetical protein|nr:hypothetical protein [Rhizomicrobium sp.]